jgi:hypothetical protein
MFSGLIDAIDSLLAFTSQHCGELSDLSTILTPDQQVELTTLDTEFHAHCQLSGLSLSIIPEPGESSLPRFGHSKLPYFPGTFHLPIKDGAGKVTHDLVGVGTMILPTPEWKHALMSLRATATLKAKIQEKGRTAGPSTPSAASEDQGASLDTKSEKKDRDDRRAGSTSGKRKRGRPAGSQTKTHDSKLYGDWKAAHRETGMTKKEFLRERSLPPSELAAIERGRKQSQEKKPPGKNDCK